MDKLNRLISAVAGILVSSVFLLTSACGEAGPTTQPPPSTAPSVTVATQGYLRNYSDIINSTMTPVNQANQALESKINTTQDMIKFMGDAKALGDKNEEAAQVLQTQVSRLSKDDVDSGISDAISVEAEAGASLYRIHSQRWRLISEYGAAFPDPFDSGVR